MEGYHGRFSLCCLTVTWREHQRAVALSGALLARGYHVQAIRPPTVPVDTSRLRVTVEATMTEETVSGFVEALDASARSLGIERRAGSHVG